MRELTLHLHIHKGDDFGRFNTRAVVIEHGGVAELGGTSGYCPAVGAGKVALEEVVAGVGLVEIAELFGDGLEVCSRPCDRPRTR